MDTALRPTLTSQTTRKACQDLDFDVYGGEWLGTRIVLRERKVRSTGEERRWKDYIKLISYRINANRVSSQRQIAN